MRQFQHGHIWLVNFDPSFGHEYQKVRPALIIQNESYIALSNLLTIIPISSQIEKFTELDILVNKDSQNRLFKNSLLKIKLLRQMFLLHKNFCLKISSFDKRRFIHFVGIVNEQIMAEVHQNLKLFLFGRN